jgi:hypothetical protein
MKQYTTLLSAVALTLTVAVGIFFRMRYYRKSFDRTVQIALSTSEGYDQRFIDMVNRLEEELETRASFGYTGGKDPMTGKRRLVAYRPVARKQGKKTEKQAPDQREDPFRLAAIIFDDEAQRYTAIVMVGERSYAVDIGDVVKDRRVTRITNDRIYFEGDSLYYYYDISGQKGYRKK